MWCNKELRLCNNKSRFFSLFLMPGLYAMHLLEKHWLDCCRVEKAAFLSTSFDIKVVQKKKQTWGALLGAMICLEGGFPCCHVALQQTGRLSGRTVKGTEELTPPEKTKTSVRKEVPSHAWAANVEGSRKPPNHAKDASFAKRGWRATLRSCRHAEHRYRKTSKKNSRNRDQRTITQNYSENIYDVTQT